MNDEEVIEIERFLAQEVKKLNRTIRTIYYCMVLVVILFTMFLGYIIYNRLDWMGWIEWVSFFGLFSLIVYQAVQFERHRKYMVAIHHWYYKTRLEYDAKIERLKKRENKKRAKNRPTKRSIG